MEINSMDFIDKLMEQEWEFYAEFAYEQFLEKGRGAIYIDLNKIRISKGPSGETNFEYEETSYVPINNRDIVGQDLHDKMLAYNPKTQVVFSFRLRGKAAKQGEFEIAPTVNFMGNIIGKPSPKEIYESKHKK